MNAGMIKGEGLGMIHNNDWRSASETDNSLLVAIGCVYTLGVLWELQHPSPQDFGTYELNASSGLCILLLYWVILFTRVL